MKLLALACPRIEDTQVLPISKAVNGAKPTTEDVKTNRVVS